MSSSVLNGYVDQNVFAFKMQVALFTITHVSPVYSIQTVKDHSS